MAPGRAGAAPASLGWTAQLRDALGRVYYNHGLFCASNPMLVLAIVVIGMGLFGERGGLEVAWIDAFMSWLSWEQMVIVHRTHTRIQHSHNFPLPRSCPRVLVPIACHVERGSGGRAACRPMVWPCGPGAGRHPRSRGPAHGRAAHHGVFPSRRERSPSVCQGAHEESDAAAGIH